MSATLIPDGSSFASIIPTKTEDKEPKAPKVAAKKVAVKKIAVKKAKK